MTLDYWTSAWCCVAQVGQGFELMIPCSELGIDLDWICQVAHMHKPVFSKDQGSLLLAEYCLPGSLCRRLGLRSLESLDPDG